jgi:hypothetical protein
MLGRPGYLYNFHSIRTLENAVSNVRRLQNTIAGLHYDRLTLVFINNAHPAFVTIDHLKFNVMVMHVVRHRAAVLNAYMRCDVFSAKSVRYQVPVLHARTSCTPGIFTGMVDGN